MPTEGDEKGTVWQLVLFITRHGEDATKKGVRKVPKRGVIDLYL